MNHVKKILVGHGEARMRRRLVLLLADAGFDVRAFASADEAAENAQGEWFDLAVVAQDLTGAPGFSFVDRLKQLQPTVPVLLLVARLELSLVVQGIRLGVADIATPDDPPVLLQRVRTLLKLETPGTVDPVTPEDLAQVESMLENISSGRATSAHPFGLHTQEPGADLLQVSKEKAVLEARVERLQHEKTALETELKTLLAQGTDAARLQAELDELRTERELAAATQAAIEKKARELAETRAAIASERSALENEKRARDSAAPVPPRSGDAAAEHAELTAWREKLAAEEDRLGEESTHLRQELMQFTQERRRLHDDLDVFRKQEENLRAYEARLRDLQGRIEADRVQWSSTNAPPAPPANDTALREAWAKLQRATELFEAERNNFRDDRLAIEDHHRAVKRREEQLRDREIQLAMQEKRLRELPPAPPRSPAVEMVKGFTRPLDLARAIFGTEKKA